MTLEQIEARLKEIRSLDLTDATLDIKALNEEMDSLNEQRKAFEEKAKQAKELRNKIANSEVETRKVEKPKSEERKMELTKENYLTSKEYRGAFLNKIRGIELNEEQRAAMALSGTTPVVYTSLQQAIIKKAREYAPVLSQITLMHVNGAVEFLVEKTVGGATSHTENASITASTEELVKVALSANEITKLVQISDSVKNMSIDAFEAWLIENLGEALAIKIENMVFTEMLAKAVAKTSAAMTAQAIYDMFASLQSTYARGAKVYANRTTIYGSLIGLQDKSKHDLVVCENGTYKLLGVEIVETPSVGDNVVLFGEPKKLVGNLAEEMNVKYSFDIDHNAHKYLGVAIFDCKAALNEAFVKLTIGA